ncbi:MAG: ATP-binding cassette domain-containing protein [Candidatus Marinimicrobia bacterium]|jgi:putative ABC transport system ATP-binding protein|nr:ATP-binding cassette domain-containing protein [Candidatus Neomarinimicrobiota bacterium]MCK9483152.1 ATP-binding cassette domain-containing protein [Candidatus Neomarinimicrobiota bacterium]MCK9559478.1 ATP-binding cassette domain-containing protein [Candidatus Neomarinimicrobiota bacterium]MDD5061909.1 ATP-binding cassette domain-containing protein [Candidatus Neomarinimicrobiota bacterium]MDD5230748.1 ATP-binding cassette domain-containing protein [Candidatus Neomarinimicrobiota bacterium
MIKIHNLHKKFNPGTVNEVYALQGVDLDVRDGDFVTIIGTNGSGKSTLLNAVAGAFLPDEGSIVIDNREVTRKPDYARAARIARVFQNPFAGTAPAMSVAENLHIASLRGCKSYPKKGLNATRMQFYREKVAVLEMQLEDRLGDTIGTLSGGQRQALSLLMAVINPPKVLLLDEHTAALDPKSAAQVIKLTKMFIEQGKLTTLMVTHSMQQALELGNRTIMMNKGQIIDDISLTEKKQLTVDELLNKFMQIRKQEQLTPELLAELKQMYA